MSFLRNGIMPRKRTAPVPGLVLLLLLGGGPGLPRLAATQITWASNAFAVNLQSDETPLDEGFVFFLGTFATGFTPGTGNVSQWAAHWRTLDATAYNVTTRRFAESTDYSVNPPGFPAGTRGYIWGSNGRCGAGEWILLTGAAWTFPAGASGPGAPTLTWSAGQAGEVVFGQVGGGGIHLRTASAGSALPATLTPAAWRSLSFTAVELTDPAVSGWEADPDGDGASNLMEYATGTAPKSASLRAWPSLAVTAGGTRLEVTLARDCRSGARWLPQESSALAGWLPAAADITQEPFTTSGFRLSLPLVQDARRFVRFNLALP
jgi:hypothetical protein